jgi:hypothetical protein
MIKNLAELLVEMNKLDRNSAKFLIIFGFASCVG